MKSLHILIVTDLEGVGGVLNFADWCVPAGARNETGCRFLTEEVNAAAGGFFDGGAEAVTVWDGHGSGGSIRGEMLDPRCELQRGVRDGWPRFGAGIDAIAFVGQHAKAGTPGGHLAHTQTPEAVDFRINGVSLGEYGQLAAVAGEEGIPVIFASGDLALVREAEALTPGVFTVAVKEGLHKLGAPAELPADRVLDFGAAALHYPRKRCMEQLRQRTKNAMEILRAGKSYFTPPALDGTNFIAAAEYRAMSAHVARQLGGSLPARRIKTLPMRSVAEAIRHFYIDLEWHAGDGREIFNMD